MAKTEYEEFLEAKGYSLKKEAIKANYGRVLKRNNTKEAFKIIVDADHLGIDLSDEIEGMSWVGELLSETHQFNVFDEEDTWVNHYEWVMEWKEYVRPNLKAQWEPILDYITTLAIEYHATAPIIAKTVMGEELGVSKTMARKYIQSLMKKGFLKEIVPSGRQANGLDHARRYLLTTKNDQKTSSSVDSLGWEEEDLKPSKPAPVVQKSDSDLDKSWKEWRENKKVVKEDIWGECNDDEPSW